MLIDRRAVIAAIPISLFLSNSVGATLEHKHKSHGQWDGTWTGNWGGQESETTSVTIVNNNVVSFEYRGVSTPVSASRVTPTTVSYDYNGVSVIMRRTAAGIATASLHSSMGDTTAQLTRR